MFRSGGEDIIRALVLWRVAEWMQTKNSTFCCREDNNIQFRGVRQVTYNWDVFTGSMSAVGH